MLQQNYDKKNVRTRFSWNRDCWVVEKRNDCYLYFILNKCIYMYEILLEKLDILVSCWNEIGFNKKHIQTRFYFVITTSEQIVT